MKYGIMKYGTWLWKASDGFRLRIFANSLTSILGIGASLLFIWSSKTLVDIATGHSHASLALHVGIMSGCLLVQILLSVISTRLNTSTETSMKNRLRNRLFTTIMESRWAGRESMHTGDILNRLEDDVRIVADLMCRTVPASVSTSVQFVAATALLASLDIRLAACVILIMPAALLISKSIMRKMRRLTREIRDDDSRVQSHLQENIQHKTLIATMERVQEVTGALDEMQSGLQKKVLKRTDYALFSKTMIQAGFSAGYLTVFLWSVYGLMRGSLTFGVMTAFLQLVAQVQRPIVSMSRLLPSFIHSTASIDRLAELSRLPAEEKGEPVKMNSRSTGIRMENVTFSYSEGEHDIISNFSHDFKPGSITAVTGATGAGKSTLIRLMLALVKPVSGKIVFYDGSISAEASPMTRCNIIYVPQGNTLISGTVRSNLLLGNPEAGEDEMRQALHTAAADFVLQMPDGLDTPCGETGAGMSEGQAQRIAIARGLLKSGGIILLDEPTSALDHEPESTLLSRLSEHNSGKTFIIVSHSEAVTASCRDRIHLSR